MKNATYKDKFAMLKEWLPSMFDSVKKDLRGEHLKQDPLFTKKYFAGKNLNKLTVEELVDGYTQAVNDGLEQVGEFISNRWLLKNTEVYNYFETQLQQINPNFQEIDELDKDHSLKLIDGATKEFGAPRTYLFAVLNSVVFPKEVYKQLGDKAKDARHAEEHHEKVTAEKESLAQIQKHHERELARVTDKFEKKLAGMQKKYLTDVETLKKQVATLQRKLNGSPAA